MATTTDQRDPDEYLRAFYIQLKLNQEAYPQWRLGQCYFNTLEQIDSVYASYVRGSLVDPYHDSKKVPDFIAWLEDRLTRPDSSK